MNATLDGSKLTEDNVMPIARVLPYHSGQAVRIPPLGRTPLLRPDPLHHFGHTAGSLYTDISSLAVLLRFVMTDPRLAEMKNVHAAYGKLDSRLFYGLGTFIIDDPSLSADRIIGHQGYAYGCVDGAFYEEDTGHMMIQLNGGASEARHGRLGILNQQALEYAFRKEIPSW